MTVALSPTSIAAFAVLTVAAGLLWLPSLIASRHSSRAWMGPALLAVVLAFVGDLVDWRGLVALLVFAAACIAAHRAPDKSARLVAHAVVVALCAGFFLHVVPGFNNPRVIDAVLIGEGASSYSKYLNFDKGMAGVLLLGLYVPERVRNDDAARRFTAFAWRFAIMVGIVVTVAMAAGYARWDPKLPDWWALWAWSMLVLTALPEEAAFRGVVQEQIDRYAPDSGWIAIITAGVLFGLAHAAGGSLYVLVASVAGVGYGWIYASTRSIAWAIMAHAGLNAIHFFAFTYP